MWCAHTVAGPRHGSAGSIPCIKLRACYCLPATAALHHVLGGWPTKRGPALPACLPACVPVPWLVHSAGQADERRLVVELGLLLLLGHEPVGLAIAWALRCLAHSPAAQDKLWAEMRREGGWVRACVGGYLPGQGPVEDPGGGRQVQWTDAQWGRGVGGGRCCSS